MKKLTPKQMFDLVDFLLECSQDYEDNYSLNTINSALKILGYEGKFYYEPLECAIRFDGVLES